MPYPKAYKYANRNGMRWEMLSELKSDPDENTLKRYAWSAAVDALKSIRAAIDTGDKISPSALHFLKEILNGKIQAPPSLISYDQDTPEDITNAARMAREKEYSGD